MPTPVTMYKTNDGQICGSLAEAIAHENANFFKEGLTPILNRLVADIDQPYDVNSVVLRIVEGISTDKTAAAELQKLFAKMPAANATAPARKRARAPRKPTKPAQQSTPPADNVSEEHMKALDGLGAVPIVLPGSDAPSEPSTGEQAPPPPPATV